MDLFKIQDPNQVLNHHEQIDAIMLNLKPQLSHMFFKKFDKNKIKKYFKEIRVRKKENEKTVLSITE